MIIRKAKLSDAQGIAKVHVDCWRIGRQLVQQLFSKLDELGYKNIFVEVLEDNKSRLFYESLGAEWLRTEKIKIAGAELNLLVYEWKDIKSVLLQR
jgi:predicted N-acetyltransferase YhbS